MKDNTKKEDLIFIDIIINIWKNKFKIIFICLLFSSIAYFAAEYFKKPNQFKIKTNIKKILFTEENEYALLNGFLKFSRNNEGIGLLNQSLKFEEDFKFSNKYLFRLFIEKLEDKKLFQNVTKKYLNKNENESKIDLDAALKKLTTSIKIYKQEEFEATIEAKYHDVKEFKKLLNLLESKINEEVEKQISNRFEIFVSNQNQLNQYLIRNLNDKILFYETEIRETAKKNLVLLYKNAQKAKDLNIKKKSPQVTISNLNQMSNEYENPKYYLLGYSFIEDRIDMIKKSLDNNILISPDAIRLKASRNLLENDEALITIQELFKNTPLVSQNKKFVAARFDIENSEVSFLSMNYAKSKIIIFALIFSFLGCIIYLMIYDSFKKKLKFISNQLQIKNK
tara:strand:+ start:2004 stop:3188 length:1185 start_codon:yes stop_codon:yes gene_type:complete